MRLAIIGCGAVTEVFHVPALMKLRITPTMLVDANVKKAEQMASTFVGSQVENSYEKCFGVCDAAIVAVPPSLHAPVCEELLQRGIHVLVEKPMACTTAECDRMIEAARMGRAVLAIGLMRRFHRSMQKVKQLIATGALGSIKTFDFSEGNVFGWPVTSPSYFQKHSARGGVALDTGAHTIDLLVWWLGEVEQIEYRDDSKGGVEANCEMQLVLASGATGVVALSRNRRMRNTAIISGSKGRLEVNFYDGKLKIELDDNNTLQNMETPETGGQSFGELFEEEIRDWLAAVKCGAAVTISGEEGRRSIAIIERCYKTRQPLTLPWEVGTEKRHESGLKLRACGSALRDRTVLVTGATGFIGGRLLEQLIEQNGCKVRCLVRKLANASRLARFDLEIIAGDATEPQTLIEASRGCDVVFHLAHDFQNEEANVRCAESVAKACLHNQVRRLVYASTICVYHPLPDGDVNELSPEPPTDWEYVHSKRIIEKNLLQMHTEHGLPVVILQPTIVYGPFSTGWTVGPVHRLRAGRVALPREGVCNPVYVDDVVQAFVLAAIRDEAVGQRFLISGPDVVTWCEFYKAYERMLELQGVSEFESHKLDSLVNGHKDEFKHRMLLNPREAVADLFPRWVKNGIKKIIGRHMWTKSCQAFPPVLILPGKYELELYRAKARVQIDHAGQRLGYEPVFSFAQGMGLTASFVKWAGI